VSTARRLLAGALLLAATVAGCAGVSRLGLLQPPSPAVTRPPPATALRALPAPGIRLGIDIDFYAWPGQDVAATARADVAYARRLHANAVAVSFPFFMAGAGSAGVHATSATPAPAALATLALDAEAAGLYVSIRPLLDERGLGMSRVRWQPARPGAWFASYQRFLLPYARMARAARIPELVTGAEFTRFGSSPYWARLDAALRQAYPGTLAYASNWSRVPTGGSTGAGGVLQTVDAYRPLHLPPAASPAELRAGWDAYGRGLPAGQILSEVGIAAVAGAYLTPYRWSWPGRALRPAIQVRWFTAACRAVADDHLGGIYFWSVGFGQPLAAAPTASDPASFVAGPGQRAIAACFRRLAPAPA
jgi:hypothetical protein